MDESPFDLTPVQRGALPPDGGPRFNRLIFARSPYLLQHAANPVDWYPWGPEAFARAEKEEKPIFLSVGYATCHWCHVMAHESFEREEVAALLNRDFVPVKVDREERPDIDHIYMTVTQGLTGRGGWPMTVVMTPEGKPFFAGTYFPPRERGGHPGLLELLPRLQEAWMSKRQEVEASAEKITEWLSRNTGGGIAPEPMGREVLELAWRQLAERFDAVHGGFGGAPKFPTPHHLLFLLRYGTRTGEKRAKEMVIETLRQSGPISSCGSTVSPSRGTTAMRSPAGRPVAFSSSWTAHFWDEAGGGFYFTADDGEPMLVRAKEFTDGAIPSGNAVAAHTLLRLARLTGSHPWEELAARLIRTAGGQLARAPMAATAMMCAVEGAVTPASDINAQGENAS